MVQSRMSHRASMVSIQLTAHGETGLGFSIVSGPVRGRSDESGLSIAR